MGFVQNKRPIIFINVKIIKLKKKKKNEELFQTEGIYEGVNY